MTFDINQFRAEIKSNGYLRPWEYSVFLTPPSGLTSAQYVQQGQSTTGSNITNMIQLRATQARTPSAQLDWLDIPRYSMGLKMAAPFNARIKTTHFAFLCDKAGNLYNFFHTWLNYVFAFSPLNSAEAGGVANMSRATYVLNYKDSYSTDVKITMYNLTGGTAMEFLLHQAFPVTMSEVILDWEDAKSLVELTVVLNYFEYSLITSNLGEGTLGSSLTSPPSASTPTLTPLINP